MIADQSHLDERYFVDETVYNCPFCNRRHVAYTVCSRVRFNWTRDKECEAFFVQCHSCGYSSMHLTFASLDIANLGSSGSRNRMRFVIPEGSDGAMLDEAFFYSVPTSFFVLDARVPPVLRELLTEAEGSLKSNFLTGASACARKIVYELAVLEHASGDNYEERIKSLKDVHPEVDGAFFDTLLTIQQVTSAKVHEQSFDGWGSKHLRIILASLREILHEIYVVPALRADRRKSVLDLKRELLGEGGGEEQSGAAGPV